MYRFGNGFGRSCLGWLGSWNVGGFPAGGILMGLIFLAVIAAVVYLAVRKRDTFPGAANAEDILKKRYARGEISREEFKDMLKELRD